VPSSLEAARNSGERCKTLLAGGSDKLCDLGLAVEIIGSGLGLAAHVVHGTRASIEHLTVTQLEAELAVDVDVSCLAGDLTLEPRTSLVQATQRQLGTALLLFEDLDRLT